MRAIPILDERQREGHNTFDSTVRGLFAYISSTIHPIAIPDTFVQKPIIPAAKPESKCNAQGRCRLFTNRARSKQRKPLGKMEDQRPVFPSQHLVKLEK